MAVDSPHVDELPRISIIVPTLDEEAALPHLLRDLARLREPHEVIVSDGGSKDRTQRIAEASRARVIRAPRGRGLQLRAGAAAARAPLLAFLHADVRLTPEALNRLDLFAKAPQECASVFRFAIDSPRPIYRVLEAGTHLRSKWLSLPYGDQGLILPTDSYWLNGGHPAIHLMEDVALARSLRRSIGIQTLDERILVSPRRWERDGAILRTVKNLSLVTRYLLGASPDDLAARYEAKNSN